MKTIVFFHLNGDNFAAEKVGGRWSRHVHGVLRTEPERKMHQYANNGMFNGDFAPFEKLHGVEIGDYVRG